MKYNHLLIYLQYKIVGWESR